MQNEESIMKDISLEILELLPDGVIMADQDGIIQFANNQVISMFGYEKAELIAQKIEILIPKKYHKNHSSHRDNYLKKPTRKLMSNREELFGLKKDGSNFPVEISLGPITIQNRVYVMAIIRDTTSRNYVQLLERKNHELEQFTYVASHDLQEPLRTVNSFSELLHQKHMEGDDEESKKYTRFIIDASTRMSQLVKSLLDHSLIGSKKELTMIDCNSLIKAITNDLNSSITETNTVFEVDDLPQIQGYEVEFRVLCQNLITNAIKFRKKDVTPIIKISSHREGNQWLFSFQDNGIGIAENHKERIFVIFQRLHSKTDYKGTGIGLAHCRKIIDLHGGRIWVESELNKGSIFYFTIPI